MSRKPICPYCQQPALFIESSAEVYSRDYGPLWICRPCQAWVGTHKNDGNPERDKNRPLGRLANAELRAAKIKAHDAFDPLWQRGVMQRPAAYKWLAREMGIDRNQCHIGLFDVGQCLKLVEICRRASPVRP